MVVFHCAFGGAGLYFGIRNTVAGRNSTCGPLPVINVTVEVVPRLLRLSNQIWGYFMTRLTWQEYFEYFIRARLQNLAASQASDRELIEGLRAIATDYKRFLFNDNSP